MKRKALFITLPEDSLDYQKPSLRAVQNLELMHKLLILIASKIMEPSVNPDLSGLLLLCQMVLLTHSV